MKFRGMCTGKVEVTSKNKAQFGNYPVGTTLYGLQGYDYEDEDKPIPSQIVLDRDTIKRILRSTNEYGYINNGFMADDPTLANLREMTILNLKLDSAGRLIRDNSYDNMIEHIVELIRTDEFVMDYRCFYEAEPDYSCLDKEAKKFIDTHSNKEPDDLADMIEDAIKSALAQIELREIKVYSYNFRLEQDGGSVIHYSCSPEKIFKAIQDTIKYDLIGLFCEYEFTLDGPPYFQNVSEKYRVLDVNTENPRELADYILEMNKLDAYDAYFGFSWVNDNMKAALQHVLSKWTLQDELNKIAGCLKAIEKYTDVSSIDAKRILTEAINQVSKNPNNSVQSREIQSKDTSYRYAAFKAISLMVKKNISNLKLTGTHRVAMKPLKIEIEIEPKNIVVAPMPSAIDELFS